MTCKCDDGSHTLGVALWHRAYCNWYDHRAAGNRARTAVWGWVADRFVALA
jgi:hypothetical protein